MFILDSLMISGISWALNTALTAAEAEMNDDSALREQLLAAEMQREMGEITDDDFAEIERETRARIGEIKERREGGWGPRAFGEGEPIGTSEDSRFQIEATVSGDFHDPADAPHTTIIEEEPAHRGIIGTASGQSERVLDVEPVHAETLDETGLPLLARHGVLREGAPTRKRAPARKRSAKKTARSSSPSRTARTTRTLRTTRTTRRTPTSRSPRTGKIR